MDSLRNSFEINLTIREAKSSGRTPTMICTEINGTRVNISSTVPIVAEVYFESNSKRYEHEKLKVEPNSYKEASYSNHAAENGSARIKRSLDFPSSSFTESHSRTKRSLNFDKKSDYKIVPIFTPATLPDVSSIDEKKRDTGGITYPYNYEKEYQKLKAKEWKFDREMKKKEECQVKEYYKQHEKMLEGWQKLNDKQNSLWEKERERERARKEEYKKQREENDKRLHAEYLKKKSQMQQQQNDQKSKKDNERENKTVK